MAETVSTGGVRIRYDDAGRGEPALLCLPGWCTSRTVFSELLHILSARHRVLCVDWRGHGESWRGKGDFGNKEMAEDAAAVIAASRAARVVPVAMSHAGWVALDLRRRLGERISRMVLLDWIVQDPPREFVDTLTGLQDPDRFGPARDDLVWRWSGGNSELAKRIQRETSGFGQEMWARAAREIASAYRRNGNPLKALSRLEPAVPVLHLYSQPRAAQYLAAHQEFAGRNPWFSARRLDGASHFPAVESPETVARSIADFAADRAGAAG